ncbi:o-succinylbenzoate synthase [Viridibacillus sp. YIM B01967]|uniref:o-succinylbenzoate synthase n=1 Tax=Viridibacillus soli TaxID=2798301 RepID=A0ABS1H587_9BACL|nr:o-succinylbenzoate synthase [Viridibacillus soli]MBK3494569.1 o-succinylbenzoate synthase [Viridibacillus soli]
MKITEVTIRQLSMRMKSPFTTSFGTVQDKQFLILEAKDESGLSGWGEGVAFEVPWYTEETVKTSWHMLEDFLIPLVLNKDVQHPDEISAIFKVIRQNNMAKATLESAVWDLYAKRTEQSLAHALGGTKEKIEVGISIGIQPTTEQLLQLIEEHVTAGYKRMKVKIKPDKDIEVIRAIRARFPEVPLMADANSAYSLDDIELLQQLDEFNLMMIEQPLASDDIINHAKLQKQLKTPICLDESICSYEDARTAIELGSCGVINIKFGRVGGLTEAKRIHDLCMQHGIKVWCGGMLESGIGRAHNVALTTLQNFVLPGDTAGSNHYWDQDIISPEVIVEDGYIKVPEGYGVGYEPNMESLEQFTVSKKVYR